MKSIHQTARNPKQTHLEYAVERIFSDWQQKWIDAVEESSLVIAAEFTAFTFADFTASTSCRTYCTDFLNTLLHPLLVPAEEFNAASSFVVLVCWEEGFCVHT
jgi:hypothetical protein